MCYTVFLSTTSDTDFTCPEPGPWRLTPVTGEDGGDVLRVLAYPNRWYVETYGGCSCHLRHSSAEGDQWFGPPEDWCPEDEDEVQATADLYDLMAEIVRSGGRLDVVDVWDHASADAVRSMDLSLAAVPRDAFQFFENVRFDVGP